MRCPRFLHLVLPWVTGNAKAWGSVVDSYGKSSIYLCLVYCEVYTGTSEMELVKGKACTPDHRFSASVFGQQQVPGKLLGDGKGQENTLRSKHLLSN